METIRIIWSLRRSLRRYFRARGIHHENAQIAAANRPSILALPDDVLFVILDVLYHNSIRWRGHTSMIHPAYIHFSMTNKRVRSLASPKLFRTIGFQMFWKATRVYDTLRSIRDSGPAMQHCREMRIHFGYPRIRSWRLLVRQIIPLLLNMPKLEKLTICLNGEHAKVFRSVCDSAHISFPHIKELVINAQMSWITTLCPNLRSLSSYGQIHETDHFLTAAGNCPQLVHFDMGCRWSLQLLKRVLELMPNLRELGMGRYFCQHNLRQLLPIWRQFKYLEALRLMDTVDLSKSEATNAEEQLFLRYLRQPARRSGITPAQTFVCKMLFKGLENLKELSLGNDFVAVAVESSDCRVNVRWEITRFEYDAELWHCRYSRCAPPGRREPFRDQVDFAGQLYHGEKLLHLSSSNVSVEDHWAQQMDVIRAALRESQ